MGNRISCFLLLVALADPAGASTVGGALLDSLSTQLKAMRALPIGTRTDAVCPDKAQSLVGLSQGQVKVALGDPDYSENPMTKWTYFLASPRPPGERGGGFPQLSFIFGATGEIVDVTCHYAR